RHLVQVQNALLLPVDQQDRGHMTINQTEHRRHRRAEVRVVLLITLRAAATTAFLFAAYYLAPVRARTPTEELLWLLVALAVFVAIVALQVHSIINTTHPRLRGVEALTMVVPLFLIVFARIYLTLSTYTPDSFSAQMNRTGSIYFTITVFSTVGFGDITPKADFARLIVCTQMLLDLVVFGAVAKLLLGAVQRNVAKRTAQTPPGEPTD
ncbi:MAG TPA: ion channel, partial [Leifsonia sp.]|nr:ion channel [Leifsonia sp.]